MLGEKTMKTRRFILASILALMHLFFCIYFFFHYFRSQDPVRDIALYIFVYIDFPVATMCSLITALFGASEEMLALFITMMGTVQWFFVGWLIQRVISWSYKFFKN